jgi:Flp pilus assembly protein TadD
MERRSELLPICSLLAFLAVAYAGALSAEFVWDDIPLIEENPRIRSLSNIPSFFTEDYWEGEYPSGLYRPLALAAHAVEFAVFGTRPAGYHAVNIALHALNALLLFGIARRLLGKGAPAWIAACLFALHPAQSESVIGVVGLSGLLSAFFGLGAWAIAPEGRRGAVAAPVLLFLSMLGKETGFVWAVPILIEMGMRGADRRALAMRAGGMLGAIALFLVVRAAALGGIAVPPEGQIFAGADTSVRAVTMLRGFARYARLLVYPRVLSGDYSPNAIRVSGRFDGSALAGLAFLLLALAAVLLARRRSPPAFLGLVLFLAALAPVSNIVFPIGAIIAERFLYAPLAGLTLAAGALLTGVLRNRRGLAVLVSFLVIVPCTARTAVRTRDWKDHETFMRSVFEAVPESYRAEEALAERLLAEGKGEEALAAARRARAIFPDDRILVLLEGRALAAAGKTFEALELLRGLAERHPEDARSRLLLAETLYNAGRPEDALREYRAALDLDRRDYRALIGIGRSLDDLGRTGEAIASYREAVAARPDLPDVWMRLGMLAALGGDARAAEYYFGRVDSGSNRFPALLQRGAALENLGRAEEAARSYELASRIDPGSPEPWIRWGALLLRKGEKGSAREKLERARTLGPGDERIGKLLSLCM